MNAGLAELKRAMQLRIFVTRLKAQHTRARAAIRVAMETRDLSLLAHAEDASRVLHGEPGLSAPAVAMLIDAGVTMARGDRERAVNKLRAAAEALERAEMAAYARSARLHLGRALGGDEGRAMATRAEAELRESGVRNVDRLAALYVAGF